VLLSPTLFNKLPSDQLSEIGLRDQVLHVNILYAISRTNSYVALIIEIIHRMIKTMKLMLFLLYFGRSVISCHSFVVAHRESRSRLISFGSIQNLEDLTEKEKKGQAHARMLKTVRRDERIATLEERLKEFDQLSPGEQKELNGLMAAGLLYEEQYEPSDFSVEHVAFKAMHNAAFCNLIEYCQSKQHERNSKGESGTTTDANQAAPINLFYLDGPDAATSSALIEYGFDRANCFVANRHGSTCEALRQWGLPDSNVAHATAAVALEPVRLDDDTKDTAGGVFGDVSFGAYYFDGCGGFAPLIVEMMSAALKYIGDNKMDRGRRQLRPPVVVGFSILGGNRNVVDKEQWVIQELVRMAAEWGLRVDHVLDDPERYGVSLDTLKVDGGTLTNWCILDTDYR